MCRIEIFTDVYPQEIRTRKIIRRCLFSPRRGTCRRTRVYDRGEMYHIQRFRLEKRQRAASPTPKYHIIQPVESRRSRERPAPIIESRKPSPSPSPPPRRRSDPIRLHLPFLRRTSSESDKNRESQMCRERVSRPFIVDFPERYRPKWQPNQRRSQTVSPQCGRYPDPEHRRQESPRDPAPSTRSPRDSQPNREPRRPRERSPVAERVPLRRRHSSPPPRVVAIHNHRPEENDPPKTSSRERNGEKRVHFASDVKCEQIKDKAPSAERDVHQGRNEGPGPHGRSDSSSDTRDQKYEIIEERPSRRQQPQEKQTREPSPWPGKQRETQRDRATPNIIHVQPRIIQDGNRHLSRAAGRICMEARGRPSYESYLDGFEPQRSRSPLRGFSRCRTFDIGNERIVIYDGDRRRWR